LAEDRQGLAAVTGESGSNAAALLSTPDLIAVGVQGDDVRRRMHGARTTFVRVFEVHVDAPISVLPSGVSAGEFRIVGKPATVEAAAGAVRSTVALANRRAPVTGFSLADLRALASSESDFAALCRQLRDLGMTAVADTPLDMFLDGSGAEENVRSARAADLSVCRLTVHAQPASGSGEMEARLAMVERARRLQVELSGFRAFAPLSRAMSIAAPTTGYQDIRQIALARVVVDNIPSIQVDWPLYGPKLAQVALTVGADDVDGVAAHDPGALGTRRSPLEEIKNNIRAAALEPVERDASFSMIT
jgi:aminodeoxyfutalosine synthase